MTNERSTAPLAPPTLALLTIVLATACGGQSLSTQCSSTASGGEPGLQAAAGSGGSAGQPLTPSASGTAGAPMIPAVEPRMEMGQWVPACLAGEPFYPVRDLAVSSDGTVFLSLMSDGAMFSPPHGAVAMCSENAALSNIALVGVDAEPNGAALLMTEQHLVMGPVTLPADVEAGRPPALVEWEDGALHRYDMKDAPSDEVVLLAGNARGALFSLYPHDRDPVLRQYDGFQWIEHSAPLVRYEPSGLSREVRALAASPLGDVYLAFSENPGGGSSTELNAKRFERERWRDLKMPSTPGESTPALRVAPDESVYVSVIDNARSKLQVLHLVESDWHALEPELDVYAWRDTAELELDAQGNPVVIADDLQTRKSSAFVWRQDHWVQLGPPIADERGSPQLAVSPNGSLYAAGWMNETTRILRYLAPGG